jgi:hypothetical protein
MIGMTFVVVFFERLALSTNFLSCMHIHPVIEWPLHIRRCDLSLAIDAKQYGIANENSIDHRGK